jgi:hypothetical protein
MSAGSSLVVNVLARQEGRAVRVTADRAVDGETLLLAVRAAAPDAVFIGPICAAVDDEFTVRKAVDLRFAEPIVLEAFAFDLGALMGTEVACDYGDSVA